MEVVESVFKSNKSKELDLKSTNKTMFGGGNGDALSVKGRSETKESKNNKFHSRLKSRNKKALKCFIYHKEGNFKSDCSDKRRKFKDKDMKSKNAEASVAHDGYDSTMVLTMLDNYCQKKWILDTWCSYHMTSYMEWFSRYRLVANGMVFMGNDQSCVVKVIGIVILVMEDGTKRVLNEIKNVSRLKRNLISLGELERDGYSFKRNCA